MRRDGKALADVLVLFVPDPDKGNTAESVSARTDADGRYRLAAPGAVAGWYRIAIEDLAIYQASRRDDGTLLEETPSRFPGAYADPLHSPLQKEVKAENHTIDLDLIDIP